MIAAVAALSACASARLVNGPYKAGEGYTVQLGRPWSDVTAIAQGRTPNVHFLTVDGPLLNRLYLAGALAPGQPLVKALRRETPTPTFRADMADTELVEFVADSIAALNYQRPETSALRPGAIGALPGIRFDITALSSEGLHMSGTGLVAREGDELHVMLYLAPTEHYYGVLLSEVESIFASAALN
ncbi:MAG: hypothetical protein AB7O04_14025 [Hyphomonadaceae bacterium]